MLLTSLVVLSGENECSGLEESVLGDAPYTADHAWLLDRTALFYAFCVDRDVGVYVGAVGDVVWVGPASAVVLAYRLS